MVRAITPTRPELAQIANNNPRVIQALEAIFQEVDAHRDAIDASSLLRNSGGVSAQGVSIAREALARGSRPSGGASAVDQVMFRDETGEFLPRKVAWDADNGALSVEQSSNVTLQVGQEVFYYAKNTSGATIADGSPVVTTGTVGGSGKLEIGPAIGDGTYAQHFFIGVATEDIPNNGFGYVTHFGVIRNIDTSSYSDGDLLYVSATTSGAWTGTAPAAPNWRQSQATVIRAHSNGAIFVRARAEHKLTALQDVSAAPSDGDILQYVSANSRWEATSGASGTFTTLDAKTVTVTNGIITAIV